MVSHRPACFTTTRRSRHDRCSVPRSSRRRPIFSSSYSTVAVLRYELAEPCDSPNVMSEDSPHAVMMPSSWSAPSIASKRPGA
jgi:hypothetical protein